MSDIHVSYEEDYEDNVEVGISYNGSWFNATVECNPCCGIKDIHSWQMNFAYVEHVPIMMEAVFAKIAEQDNGAYVTMVTIKTNGIVYPSRAMQLMDEYLSAKEGVITTPWRVNTNSGNLIHVHMIPLWGDALNV